MRVSGIRNFNNVRVNFGKTNNSATSPVNDEMQSANNARRKVTVHKHYAPNNTKGAQQGTQKNCPYSNKLIHVIAKLINDNKAAQSEIQKLKLQLAEANNPMAVKGKQINEVAAKAYDTTANVQKKVDEIIASAKKEADEINARELPRCTEALALFKEGDKFLPDGTSRRISWRNVYKIMNEYDKGGNLVKQYKLDKLKSLLTIKEGIEEKETGKEVTFDLKSRKLKLYKEDHKISNDGSETIAKEIKFESKHGHMTHYLKDHKILKDGSETIAKEIKFEDNGDLSFYKENCEKLNNFITKTGEAIYMKNGKLHVYEKDYERLDEKSKEKTITVFFEDGKPSQCKEGYIGFGDGFWTVEEKAFYTDGKPSWYWTKSDDTDARMPYHKEPWIYELTEHGWKRIEE